MAVRFHATVKRVGGDPHPLDPGSMSVDFSIPRHAVYQKTEAAKERVRDSLARQYGGEWEVVSMHTTHLRGGRR